MMPETVYLVSTPDQIGPAFRTLRSAMDWCDTLHEDAHGLKLSWRGAGGVWQDIQTGDYDIREVELVSGDTPALFGGTTEADRAEWAVLCAERGRHEEYRRRNGSSFCRQCGVELAEASIAEVDDESED